MSNDAYPTPADYPLYRKLRRGIGTERTAEIADEDQPQIWVNLGYENEIVGVEILDPTISPEVAFAMVLERCTYAGKSQVAE